MDVAVFGKNSESIAESTLTCGAQRRVSLLLASTAHHETAGRIGRKIAIAVGLTLSQAAVAAPPDSPDPALAPWFETPGTGAPCCSIADCRTVEFRQDRDGYEVLIDGRWKMSNPFWLRVPPNRIIDRTDNPTNRAVVCFRSNGLSHQVDQSAAPRATAREPISGCSPGVRRPHSFIRARQFPGLRRHHGGRTCRNWVPLG